MEELREDSFKKVKEIRGENQENYMFFQGKLQE